jgi:hypothetical protein
MELCFLLRLLNQNSSPRLEIVLSHSHNTDEKAKASLKNSELLQRFREVEALPEREQTVLLEIIGAYIRDYLTKQAYVH